MQGETLPAVSRRLTRQPFQDAVYDLPKPIVDLDSAEQLVSPTGSAAAPRRGSMMLSSSGSPAGGVSGGQTLPPPQQRPSDTPAVLRDFSDGHINSGHYDAGQKIRRVARGEMAQGPTPYVRRRQSAAATRWALLRRLQGENTLVYTAQERDMTKLQAALRNRTKGGAKGGVGAAAKVDGADEDELQANLGRFGRCCFRYAVEDNSMWKQKWDLLISTIIIYSVCVLPWRLGFGLESDGTWYFLVRLLLTLFFVVCLCIASRECVASG